MKIRVSLEASDRFTERWSGTQRDFLAERIGPLAKPKQRRHALQ